MAKQPVTEDVVVLRLKLQATERLINRYDEKLVQLAEMTMAREVKQDQKWAGQVLKVAKQIYHSEPVGLIATSLIAADLAQIIQRDEKLRLRDQIRHRLTTIGEMQFLTEGMQPALTGSYPSLPAIEIEGFVTEVLAFVLDVMKFLDTLRKPAMTLRAQFIEKLNHSTSTITDSEPQPPGVPVPEVWPPDDGWHFRPGRYAFYGCCGELEGVPLKLLKTLSGSRYGLMRSELIQIVWDGEERVDGTIRATLHKTRESLRETFGLGAHVDPIPALDRGEQCAWCIDRVLLESSAANRKINTG